MPDLIIIYAPTSLGLLVGPAVGRKEGDALGEPEGEVEGACERLSVGRAVG
jgi:hypothetical protein